MDVKELKTRIELKTVASELLILKYSDSNFIPNQYVNQIAKDKNIPIEYIGNDINLRKQLEEKYKNNSKLKKQEKENLIIEELISTDLDNLVSQFDSLFGCPDFSSTLKVVNCNTFKYSNELLNKVDNLIILCRTVDKSVQMLYNNIVDIPKIEEWQLKDYAYSICEGVDTKKLDTLINNCKDVYKLNNELQKLTIFPENEREIIFNQCMEDGVFSDLGTYQIYDFTNALVAKDLKTMNAIYKVRFNCDIEPLGVATLMIRKFKQYINIRLAKNPTAELCGMSDKQFYVVKKSSMIYTNSQLINIYQKLLQVDKLLKTGRLEENYIIDYIVTAVLTTN